MKHNIKKLFALSLVMFGATTMMAQDLNSAYFTDGYLYRYQMNPAIGNDSVTYIAVPLLGNMNIGLHGNIGLEDVLFDTPANNYGATKRLTTFMHPGIPASEALSGFKDKNKVVEEMKVGILSAGWKGFGGYNTIAINLRENVGLVLPYELFEFAKNTGNKSYNIGDITMMAQSFVEVSLGHSHKINDRLNIGANLKFLLGAGRMDFAMKDMKADFSDNGKWIVSGDAQLNASIKGLKYKSEAKEYKSKPGSYEYVNDVDIDGAGLNGFGMAVDLGATYKITDDLTASAALLDLGYINWSNNMYATNGKKSFEFDGFHDVDVKKDRPNAMENITDTYGDQIADFANLQDKGDQGSRSEGIGATMNLGLQYTLPVYRKLSFGALSSTRFRDDFTWTEARFSANWAPLKWLGGGMSLAFNSFTTSAGWVLNIHPKGFHFFVGMDHIVGKTNPDMIPLSTNASLNLGMSVAF